MFRTLLLNPSVSWRLWTLMAIGGVLVIAGIIFDVRLVAVGLMICLTIIPTVAFFMFFKTMLSEDVLPNLLPHSVCKERGSFVLTTFREEHADEDSDDIRYVKTGSFIINEDAGYKCSFISEYRVLWLKNDRFTLLFLPY